MTRTTTYNPHEHAEQLGIAVEYQSIRTGVGLYVPTRNLILLRPRLSRITERSVLSHEIAHHLASDRRVNGLWSIRQERRADSRAAHNLIHPELWDDVIKWTHDPLEACRELGVTGDLFLAYAREHPQAA